MKRIILSLTLTALLTMSVSGQNFDAFGESFTAERTIDASELTKIDLSKVVDDMQITGEVNAVCQAAGCWMTIKLDNGETMRVTFKDYGFFVPKNLADSKVIFKGKPEVTETSVSDLRHYAADAGKSEVEIAAITEPEIALTFVADGVLVPKK